MVHSDLVMSFNSRLREEATHGVTPLVEPLLGFNSRLREEATGSWTINEAMNMFQLTPP